MRRRILLGSFIVILFYSLVYSQEEVSFKHSDSWEITYDYGETKEGDKISHLFAIKNSSSYPWQIKRILPSCGCVSANLVDENGNIIEEKDNVVKKGEIFRIKMEIDTTGHSGLIEQFVYVNILEKGKLKIMKLIMKVKVTKE